MGLKFVCAIIFSLFLHTGMTDAATRFNFNPTTTLITTSPGQYVEVLQPLITKQSLKHGKLLALVSAVHLVQ